jgi:uncharacterized integral membrane protein
LLLLLPLLLLLLLLLLLQNSPSAQLSILQPATVSPALYTAAGKHCHLVGSSDCR